MKTGFSVINILIILGLVLLAYLGYTQYLDNKVKEDLSGSVYRPKRTAPEKTQPAAADLASKNQPAAKNIAVRPTPSPAEEKTTPPSGPKGYYQNYTYFYEISFPESWPIKVRSESVVSFGAMPPKNGQGAITIEITQGENNELDQAKAEAKKYAGLISLTEEPIVLAGLSGDKIIMDNFLAKTKTIIIMLKKSGLNYLIKYSEESPEFTGQVNKALATFKFTK